MPSRPSARVVALVLGVGLLAALPLGRALAEPTAAERAASVDDRLDEARAGAERARTREERLQAEIAAASAAILETRGDLAGLEASLADLRTRLADEREALARVRAERTAVQRRARVLALNEERIRAALAERLVALYRRGSPTALELLLTSGDLGSTLTAIEEQRRIAQADEGLAERASAALAEAETARDRLTALADEVAARVGALRAREEEVAGAVDAARAERDRLAAQRAERSATLAQVEVDREEFEEEVAALERESAAIRARIEAAREQAPPDPPSGGGGGGGGGGLAWPLAGPITSGFGWRWGRMHEGLDIGCSMGAPIRAAAAGTVIFAGWQGGYGNFVMIQHSSSLVTAYGHLSSISRGSGSVGAGDVIAACGSTGHSTGPHLHFEVRVNGAAVDPLGYL